MGDAPTELAPEEHEKSAQKAVPRDEKEAPPSSALPPSTMLDRTVEFPTPSSGKAETNDEKDDKADDAEKGDEKSGKDEIDDSKKTREQHFEQTEEEEEEEEDIDVSDWPVSDDFLLIKCVENGCALESLAENKVVNFFRERVRNNRHRKEMEERYFVRRKERVRDIEEIERVRGEGTAKSGAERRGRLSDELEEEKRWGSPEVDFFKRGPTTTKTRRMMMLTP